MTETQVFTGYAKQRGADHVIVATNLEDAIKQLEQLKKKGVRIDKLMHVGHGEGRHFEISRGTKDRPEPTQRLDTPDKKQSKSAKYWNKVKSMMNKGASIELRYCFSGSKGMVHEVRDFFRKRGPKGVKVSGTKHFYQIKTDKDKEGVLHSRLLSTELGVGDDDPNALFPDDSSASDSWTGTVQNLDVQQ
jgi:hypothetical protein